MSRHDPEQVATAADVITRNARAQAVLISNLLDANALANARVTLDLHRVDVAGAARKAIDAFRPRADAAGVSLTGALPDRALVLADAARVDQVLGYLLEHALHASRAGGAVALSVTTAPGGDVDITVTDTGARIPPALLPSVFDTFTNPSAARLATGQRVGLAIVKYVAQLHGGGVTASSASAGMGTMITVHLPGGGPDRHKPSGEHES